jgi:hypothetical protein
MRCCCDANLVEEVPFVYVHELRVNMLVPTESFMMLKVRPVLSDLSE